MKGLLKRNRLKINQDLKASEKRRFFSPATFGDSKVTIPAITKYCRGNLIDIGCGDMPYRDVIARYVSRYDSLDVERRVPGVTFVSDVQDMDVVADESYDSAVCFEVLEHVPDPIKALSEIHRILKENGVLILTAPHLSRVHEAPYDFFRYTQYGLVSLLKNTGFNILEIKTRGGIFSFLGHQVSTIFLCLFWHLSVIKDIVFFFNKWVVVKLCYYLDRVLGPGPFPLGYTAVVQKQDASLKFSPSPAQSPEPLA